MSWTWSHSRRRFGPWTAGLALLGGGLVVLWFLQHAIFRWLEVRSQLRVWGPGPYGEQWTATPQATSSRAHAETDDQHQQGQVEAPTPPAGASCPAWSLGGRGRRGDPRCGGSRAPRASAARHGATSTDRDQRCGWCRRTSRPWCCHRASGCDGGHSLNWRTAGGLSACSLTRDSGFEPFETGLRPSSGTRALGHLNHPAGFRRGWCGGWRRCLARRAGRRGRRRRC